MGKDALQRLYEDSSSLSNLEKFQYSLDEQLDGLQEEEDFIGTMGKDAQETLMSKIQKVEMDEEEKEKISNFLNEDVEEDSFKEDDEEEGIEESEEEIEVKRGRGRPRKNPEESTQPLKTSNNFNAFMDSLARDLVKELKNSNYTTRNFSREQMLVILDYLEKKI